MSGLESAEVPSGEAVARSWVSNLYEPVRARLRALVREADAYEVLIQGGLGLGLGAFVEALAEQIAPGSDSATVLPDAPEPRRAALGAIVGRMEGPPEARPKVVFVHEIESLFGDPDAIPLLARILVLASAPDLPLARPGRTRIVATSALLPLQLVRDAMTENLEDPYVSSLVQRFALSEGGPSFFRLNPWLPGWRTRLADAARKVAVSCGLTVASADAWVDVVAAQTGGHPALVPPVLRAMATHLREDRTADPAAGPTLAAALRAGTDTPLLARWVTRWLTEDGLVPVVRAVHHVRRVEPEDHALLLDSAEAAGGEISLPNPSEDVIGWARTAARLTATGLCFEDADGRLRFAGEVVRTYLASLRRSELQGRAATDPVGARPPPPPHARVDTAPLAVTVSRRDGGAEVTLRGVELRVWRALVGAAGAGLADAELIARAQLASPASLTSAIQRLRLDLAVLGDAVVVERERGVGYRLVGVAQVTEG